LAPDAIAASAAEISWNAPRSHRFGRETVAGEIVAVVPAARRIVALRTFPTIAKPRSREENATNRELERRLRNPSAQKSAGPKTASPSAMIGDPA
jgi:hypothetical protein